MNDETPSGMREKKPVGGDLIIPVAGIVFMIYYVTTIWDSAWTAQVSAFFVGAVLMAVSVVFLARTLLRVLRGEADLGLDRLIEPRAVMPRRAGLFGLTLAYIFLIDWGGFTLTTFAFLASAMLLLTGGRNWKFILGLSAAMAIGGYFLFVYAFEVRFPKGAFEIAMAQVM